MFAGGRRTGMLLVGRLENEPICCDRERGEPAHRTRVNSVLDEFVARYASKKKSGDEVMRTFHRLVRRAIGLKSIYLLKRSEIVGMLDEIEDRNGPVMADQEVCGLSPPAVSR